MLKRFHFLTLLTIAFFCSYPLESVTNYTVTTNGDTAPTTGGAPGDLRFVLNTINQSGPDTYNITFNLTNASITLGAMLPILNMTQAGNTLNINGNNNGSPIVIDGQNSSRGFFARQGSVNIQNISFFNVVAVGGNGGSDCGGGGMGAGAALFIDGAITTISNMSCGGIITAVGGSGAANTGSGGGGGGGGMGGQGGATHGGGGGLGGAGGDGSNINGFGGGGGIGFGVGAGDPGRGGDAGTNGTDGLDPGAGSGGDGFGGATGGASAGGGGGGASGGGGGGGDGGDDGVGTGFGGNGGYGGGGGADADGPTFGNGGFGGGSGGNGGTGGFGGGGGGGGGNGGFGGGASGDGGTAGPGGGNTSTSITQRGGGGMGAGGAFFINSAGSLTVTGPLTISGSQVFPGTGDFDGAAVGDDFFVVSGGTPLTFNLGASETVAIDGAIADDSLISLPSGQSYAPGTGTGASLIKQGLGILQLDGNNTYAGATQVVQGRLILNGQVSGMGSVSLNAILSGTGFVAQNLFIEGTIIPGSETTIGTLTVGGNYSQPAGSTYRVQINGAGQSSLIDISGTATLSGGAVVVTTLDGQISPNPYTIVASAGGVAGQYAGASSTNTPGFIPVLTYDANHVFLTFIAAPNPPRPDFIDDALTFNQRQVAMQLDNITDPTDALADILSSLAGLSPEGIRLVLDQMSAVSYANLLLTAQQANSRFIRSLYNPLRDIITCPQGCCCDTCCCDPCSCMENQTCCCGPLDVWFQASAEKTHAKSDSNARGFTNCGYELTLGAQTTLDCQFTVGSAFAYSHENVNYNICAHGRNNNFFGALYGLYRPCKYYLLADVAFGYRTERVKRHIDIADLHFKAHGRPKTYQSAFYSEFGLDWNVCSLLIQPFAGMELGYYRHGRIREHGAEPLNVEVVKHGRFAGISRLGVHLTTRNITCFTVTADLAWNYYFTDIKNNLREHFQSFGTCFPIHGIKTDRNSIDGALNVSTEFCDCWEVFTTVSGQLLQRAYSYQVLGGIKVSW